MLSKTLYMPFRSILISLAFLFASGSVCAQDSTKVINNEIGFNTVLLVKQLLSNNPNSTLAQLPYSIFYNMYFKDMIGIRMGLGYMKTVSETSIEGQPSPRETEEGSTDLRVGLSYNFVRHSRITLNAFVDGTYTNSRLGSTNTSTMFAVPANTITISTKSLDKITGSGAQIGVGVKYNLYKHLSIYAEVPIGILNTKTTSEVVTTRSNGPVNQSSSTSTESKTYITIPTTIYLVLRF